jgi:nitroreductase
MRHITVAAAALLILAGDAVAQKDVSLLFEPVATTASIPFDTVMLVPPDLDLPARLMKALEGRRSVREYDTLPVTLRHLSELLWAANGVNRGDGRRTAPAAVNQQITDIYVILPGGAYLYDAPGSRLLPVASGDLRSMAGRQEFVKTAPVNLIYVADPARFKSRPGPAPQIPDEQKLDWARIAVGAQAQNVGLYCASEKLGNVVRASVDRKKLGPALKLSPSQVMLLAQTIGVLKSREVAPASGTK